MGTEWTPLHAAAFQEHGKITRILLDNGADPFSLDANNITPVDYGSVSIAIWPFFSVRGCERSSKHDLIEKGLIRKLQGNEECPDESQARSSSHVNKLSSFSRPGSAYVRVDQNPFQIMRKGKGNRKEIASGSKNQARLRNGAIDPLAAIEDVDEELRREPTLRSCTL